VEHQSIPVGWVLGEDVDGLGADLGVVVVFPVADGADHSAVGGGGCLGLAGV
jgi:hypothetical protein